MAHRATDGKEFTHVGLYRKYQQSLDENKSSQVDRGKQDVAMAPGGPQHEHNLREHGIVTETSIKNEGPGRWRHTAVHADGHVSTSVHPEAFRAHQVEAQYLSIEPPPAIQTHSRARAHPTGPKESERIAREDGREEDEE